MAKPLETIETLDGVYNRINRLAEECKITSNPDSQIFSAFNNGVSTMASIVKAEILAMESDIRMKEMLNVGGEK